MKIRINGQEKVLTQPQNLQSLIKEYSKNTRVIAEINGDIVKNETWEQTLIKDGDTIELVAFVGGG